MNFIGWISLSKKNILLKMCKYLETTELFHKRFMYYTQEMIKRSNTSIRRSKSTFSGDQNYCKIVQEIKSLKRLKNSLMIKVVAI
jgi:hypothetical protein